MFDTEMTSKGQAMVAWHHSVSDMRVPGRAPLCRDTVIDGVPLFIHTNHREWFTDNGQNGITSRLYKILLSPEATHITIDSKDRTDYVRCFCIKDLSRDDSGFILTDYGRNLREMLGVDIVTLLESDDPGETIIINPSIIMDIQEIEK